MYMYRKVSEYLKQWKDSKYRKPLIIQGARQVGKTYAILEFGRRYYDNVAYFNFQTTLIFRTISFVKCFFSRPYFVIQSFLLQQA